MRYALLFIAIFWCGQGIGMDDDGDALNPLLGQFPEGTVGLTPAAHAHHWESLPSDSDDDDNGITPTTSVFARVRTDIVRPREIIVSRDERVKAHDGIIFDDKETYQRLVALYSSIVVTRVTHDQTRINYRERINHLNRTVGTHAQLFAYDQFGGSVLYGRDQELIFKRSDLQAVTFLENIHDPSSVPPFMHYTAYSAWHDKECESYYIFAADSFCNIHSWQVPESRCHNIFYKHVCQVSGKVTAIRQIGHDTAAVFFKDTDENDRAGVITLFDDDRDDGLVNNYDCSSKWKFDPLAALGATHVVQTGIVPRTYHAIAENKGMCEYIERQTEDGPIFMPGDEGTFY